MKLDTGYIRDVLEKALKSVTTEKKTFKHSFTNKNEYDSRSITLSITDETTEKDIEDNVSSIVNILLLDNVDTTYVTKRQRYSKSKEASLFSVFSTVKYKDFYLMYHLTPVTTDIYEKTIIDDNIIKDFKYGKLDKESFFKIKEKVRKEVNLTLTVMFIKQPLN